ncbi:hypothetical protein SLEP1_g56561 [Rubroshorea leprosula]|uniref:CG-1 domain-containing protein n=1 Tax=Rubroshorea leprosula TaxID=152421 RepID=A0AAV5MLU6_9ROSI|nr:hypothetical protein SLEP1_g56561 [Rubroshorea leprosula]
MEAHQKLKVGSTVDLNCYYAHGQENENFQRRCYWMLKGMSEISETCICSIAKGQQKTFPSLFSGWTGLLPHCSCPLPQSHG